MPEPVIPPRMCPHCGAVGATRLGHCKVCSAPVCEKCGNTQYAHGVKEVTHNACLRQTGDSFSMIKFVE